MSKSVSAYSSEDKGGYFAVTLDWQSSYTHDGTLANPKITNSTYTYDSYGNPVWVNSLGDRDTTGDEKYEHYSYATNTSAWIVDRVSNYSLYADDNATLARQTIYYYDSSGYGALGSQGALTKVERWLDTELANPTTEYTYDEYGNVLTETDALGRVTTYYYGLRDSTYTFADRVVNALDHPVDFSYDLGSGNLLWEETNNVRTTKYYDVHGRIEKEVEPYDTEQLPTKSYEYNLTGSAPESIIVKQRTTANNTIDRYYFYDGLGRVVQVRSPADNSQQVIADVFYDGLGRVDEKNNPYFESFSTALGTPSIAANKSTFIYDVLDRPTQVLNPDGTTLNTTFDHWNVSSYDTNGHRISYALDAYGRILQVFEYNNDPVLYFDYESDTYVTNYSYNAADQLVNITDFEGNEFMFTFDSLGRRTVLEDPDIGTWMYTYDLLGKLVSQTGGGGNLITGDSYYREYNDLNQLIRVRSGNLSNGTILEEYLYDAYGDRVKVWKPQDNETIYTPFREFMRIVNSSGTYDYLYVYDGGTLVSRLNPDGTKNFYHPDHLGSTSLITDETGAIKEETFYEPFGAVTGGGTEELKLYTGQFSDSVDQYYFGTRYYKSAWGRFIQPDSTIPQLYTPQDLNHYAYTRNSPYIYTDDGGQEPITATAVGIGAAWIVGRGLYEAIANVCGEEGYSNEAFLQGFGKGLAMGTVEVGIAVGAVAVGITGGVNFIVLGVISQGTGVVDTLLLDQDVDLTDFPVYPPSLECREGSTCWSGESVVPKESRVVPTIDVVDYYVPPEEPEYWITPAGYSISSSTMGTSGFGAPSLSPVSRQDVISSVSKSGGGYSGQLRAYVTKEGRVYPTTNKNWKPQSERNTKKSDT